MELNDYLNRFEKELLYLNETNLVLCGSQILKLHGLHIGWEPKDLDVAIYSPKSYQESYVINKFKECLNYPSETLPRAYEMVHGNYKLNVMLDMENSVPDTALITYRGFFIQSIDEIIKWKVSYSKKESKEMVRAKDALHLQSLKNLNFNYEPRTTI